MHRPQLITWTTHTEESTTLLEATRLQEVLLYTTLHYTYMCNIVTEFYLYSIVYIYLINSRLDVTTSVRHHFRTATLSESNQNNLILQPLLNVSNCLLKQIRILIIVIGVAQLCLTVFINDSIIFELKLTSVVSKCSSGFGGNMLSRP